MRYDQLTIEDAQQWTELTNTFVPMDHRIGAPERWTSTLSVQQTSTYSLLRWDEPGDRVAYRTPTHVRRTPADDFYWLVLPRHAPFTLGWQGDGLTVPPGRALLMGLDQVCRMRPGPTALALQLPRTEIDHAVPGARPAGDRGGPDTTPAPGEPAGGPHPTPRPPPRRGARRE
ncbi:hypothetical protein, partial [Nocardia wallacei]|uniref:hypothetical protein n=1 Tax=Nocardia wallacei TaxID=480035 RepID=UPI002454D9C2